jgi:hypothetical protein
MNASIAGLIVLGSGAAMIGLCWIAERIGKRIENSMPPYDPLNTGIAMWVESFIDTLALFGFFGALIYVGVKLWGNG